MTGEFVLATAPAAEPLTKAEAKAHLNLTIDDDDDLVDRLIAAARRRAESHLDRSLVNTTWDYRLDDFPAFAADSRRGRLRAVVIPKARLQSVTSVKYYDTTNVEQTITASEYVVLGGEPGLVYPAPGYTWPDAHAERLGAVTIRCVVGYGATAASVPEDVKAALLLMVGHLYVHRMSVEDTDWPLPNASRLLLDGASWGSRP